MNDQGKTRKIIQERRLKSLIHNLHWMARRYADMRSSYAPSLLNGHVRDLLKWGYELREPLFARDGMGRSFDGLSDKEVAAAEEDMPRGMQQVVAEQEARLTEFRNAVIEECAKAAEADNSFLTLQDFGLQSAVTQKGQNIAEAIRALKQESAE